MRVLQTAHGAAAQSAHAQVAGAVVLPMRHPAKLNGETRRPDTYYLPQLALDRAVAAPAPPQPLIRPRPVRGRRATDRRPTAFPHPSQLKPQAPFMAQLMSQGQPPALAASRAEVPPAAPATAAALPSVPARLADGDLVTAQRRHFQQVGAYRKTATMATDFIIRRYHLTTDFQGLILTDARAVEMVV